MLESALSMAANEIRHRAKLVRELVRVLSEDTSTATGIGANPRARRIISSRPSTTRVRTTPPSATATGNSARTPACAASAVRSVSTAGRSGSARSSVRRPSL